jgi:DNA invertase Pin-like site-specific DNA recombinase
MGGEKESERPGLRLFLEEKDSRGIEVLLILDSSRLYRDRKQCREFLLQVAKSGIQVYSPLEGMLSASRCQE